MLSCFSALFANISSNQGPSLLQQHQSLTSKFSGICECSCNGAVDEFATGQADRAVLAKVTHAPLELCGCDAHVRHGGCFPCNGNTIMSALFSTNPNIGLWFMITTWCYSSCICFVTAGRFQPAVMMTYHTQACKKKKINNRHAMKHSVADIILHKVGT